MQIVEIVQWPSLGATNLDLTSCCMCKPSGHHQLWLSYHLQPTEQELVVFLQALALGADAVCVGRPILHCLAVNGQQGVEDVLRMMLWHTRDVAILLRAEGREIPSRAEDEQAAALAELLVVISIHGQDWRDELVRRLRAARDKAAADKEGKAA